MTDQNPSAHDSQNPPTGQSDGPAQGAGSWSAESPAPAASDVAHTRPLPPFQQPASATTSAPVGRSGGVTAAVLAGALLLGGAAGVGGAAAYDALNGDDVAATSASPSGPVKASNAATAPSGSV